MVLLLVLWAALMVELKVVVKVEMMVVLLAD